MSKGWKFLGNIVRKLGAMLSAKSSQPSLGKNLRVSWKGGLRDSYTSGDTLMLFLDKFGKELTIEIKDNKNNFRIVLIPELKPNREEKIKGIRRLEDSSNFNGIKIKDIDQTYKPPCIFLKCVYLRKNKKLASIFPSNINRVPVPISVKGDEEIDLTIKCTELDTEKVKFHWPTRRMSRKEKFLNFLKWQNELIYGPSGVGYNKGAFVCRPAWDPRKKGKGLLNVSGTGNKRHAMVCSPLSATFLGFWLNYNQYFTWTSGGHRTAYSAPTGKMWTPPGKKPDGSPKKPRKNNGYGPFLDEITNPKFPTKKELYWSWKAFWDNVLSDEENTKPGDIFACAIEGHSFLIAKFGNPFSFPKHYIFGGLDTGDCEKGIYVIQASGPGPGKILYDKYKRGKDKLDKVIQKFEKKSGHHTEAGISNEQIALNLKNAQTEMNNEGYDGIFVFNATKLTTMNGKIYEDKLVKIEDLGIDILVHQDALYLVDFLKGRGPCKNKLMKGDQITILDEIVITEEDKPLCKIINKIDKVYAQRKEFSIKLTLQRSGINKLFVKEVHLSNKRRRPRNPRTNARTVLLWDYGLDENGHRFIRKVPGWKFSVWKVKDVLDNNGMIDKEKAEDNGISFPIKMWRGGSKVDAYLNMNECSQFKNG